MAGLGALALPSILAACGGSEGGSSSAASSEATTAAAAAETTAATTAAAAAETTAAASAATSAVAGDVGSTLAALLGVDAASAGAGQAWKIGANLPLSGPGAESWGKTMKQAIELGVQHIAAAGGPAIEVVYTDNKTGDPQAGKDNATQLLAAGVPAMIGSLVNNFATLNDATTKGPILTLDGGGGTSTWNVGVPFFYGTRAISPDDCVTGMGTYMKATWPDKKTWTYITWQLDPQLNESDKQNLIAKMKELGYPEPAAYEYVAFGQPDYSASIAKLRAANADFCLVGIYGTDPGLFADQARQKGLSSQLIGFEWTPEGVAASKGSWDDDGWVFAQDFFDPTAATSDLGKLFVSEYEAAYGGEKIDFYTANYYENTLALWDLYRRVTKAGGDVNSAKALDDALQADPVFASVYGGDGATSGTYTLDAATHSVSQRPLGVFEYAGGTATTKATFDVGGGGYQAV